MPSILNSWKRGGSSFEGRKEGEEFVTLDGVKRTLDGEMLMICDGVKPVAIAGVMGGLNSEIREDTKTVLLESAYFNPVGKSEDLKTTWPRDRGRLPVRKRDRLWGMSFCSESGGPVDSGIGRRKGGGGSDRCLPDTHPTEADPFERPKDPSGLGNRDFCQNR